MSIVDFDEVSEDINARAVLTDVDRLASWWLERQNERVREDEESTVDGKGQ